MMASQCGLHTIYHADHNASVSAHMPIDLPVPVPIVTSDCMSVAADCSCELLL